MHTRGGQEPFGFADGVSQPWIAGVHPRDPRRFGGGKLVRRRGRLTWEPIALGEFILGEVDEGEDIALVPTPSGVFRGATFLVIRKLDQDVRAFHAWTARAAGDRPWFRADLEEKLVGRRRDGSPLAAPSDLVGEPRNNFTFGLDPEGFDCPMSAHIRRANPRDGLGFDGEPANRRRMIRRGMPYRDPDGHEGLVFAAICASLLGQFEFVQRQWLNDGNPFRVGAAPDLIAGSWAGPRDVVVHDRNGPVVARVDHPFVRTRGGAYFVLPTIAGLWYLAASKGLEEVPQGLIAGGGKDLSVLA
jgi:Dyp-type peroxidase family